jgi:molecular chaperone DnaK (HSP70)
MTQAGSAIIFTDSIKGPSPLVGDVLREMGITPVLPHQLSGSSNGVSVIIIERSLDRAETICLNLRKYQEYSQAPILVLAESIDSSKLPRFKELKAEVLTPPITAAAVRKFLTERLSSPRAAQDEPPATAPDKPAAAKTPPPAGTETRAAAATSPKEKPGVTPRPFVRSEPPAGKAAAKEARKVMRPAKDDGLSNEEPPSAQLLTGNPDAATLPKGSVRCGQCLRWQVRREDAFCSRCGEPLIVLKMPAVAVTFEPRGNHEVGRLIGLKNTGQNPLRMTFNIRADEELESRLSLSASGAVLNGGASGDLRVMLDARGLDLSNGYEATLEINTNESRSKPHLVTLCVERLPRPRISPRGEYVYSLFAAHQPNQWEFSLANDGGRTLSLKSVEMVLPGGDGEGTPLKMLDPSPIMVRSGQTVPVRVQLPELKLSSDNYSGRLTCVFEQHDPVSLDLAFEAKNPRNLTVQPADFLDLGVVSTRRAQTFTLNLRNTGAEEKPLKVESIEVKPAYQWATFSEKVSFPLEIPFGSSLILDLQLNGSGVAADVYEGKLVIHSDSYRNPTLTIPFIIEFKEPEVFDGYMGIDFGTTASCVAVFENGDTRLIPIDLDGERPDDDGTIMPSMLYFLPDGQVLAGHAALQLARPDPENSVSAIKRALGMRSTRRLAGRDYDSTELASLVIKELRERAESALFKDEEYKTPKRAVLTMPVDFAEKQRRALLEASNRAGLDDDTTSRYPTVLDEALAVALYYQRKSAGARLSGGNGEPERLLVFDFGGGTLDCGLIEIQTANQKTIFRTLATYGDSTLGGEDIDWALVAVLAEKAAQTYPELDRRCLEKPDKPGKIERLYRNERIRAAAYLVRGAFKEVAEQAKKALCSAPEFNVKIQPLLRQGASPTSMRLYVMREDENATESENATFETTLRREDFERVLEPFIQRALKVVEMVCARGQIKLADVRTILHAGRSSLIPQVRQRVNAFLPNVTDRTEMIEPKVCVALGAAYYGRRKSYPTQSFEIIGGANRVVHDIGYIDLDQEGDEEVFISVIRAQTPFPTTGEVKLPCGSGVIDLQVAENRGMSNRVINNPDIRYGNPVRIDARGNAGEDVPVQFSVNDDGLIEISVNGVVQRVIEIGD